MSKANPVIVTVEYSIVHLHEHVTDYKQVIQALTVNIETGYRSGTFAILTTWF